MKLRLREAVFEFPARPLIMGIVNLGADSFSGDGLTDIDAACELAARQLADGADIIDIGAESARTNRAAISEQDEAAQLLRFIERWPSLRGTRSAGAAWPQLSINTWRSGVVRAVLPRGGDLLNDISGLPTDENARICADTGAALLIMHSVGEPKVPHTHVSYLDVMQELDTFFAAKIAIAESAGVARESIVLDPGIDFAKQRPDNLRIMRELDRLHHFGRPILLPISRKTVIGQVLDLPDPRERDPGTVACLVQGMAQGAAIFRVHNVRAAVQTSRTIWAVENASTG
ncbi:MAG TPA: dihydropteroate synthase [Chthoniobacteraceae bacterium]|nr:dihydropteroate synthase [Chthoniobacteraceae bacterium]